MRLSRFTRTTAFRLTLLYVGLFGVSVLAVLGLIYFSTAKSLDGFLAKAIEDDVKALSLTYAQRGREAMLRQIDDQGRGGSGALYRLTGPAGEPIGGNIVAAPAEAVALALYVDFLADGRPARGRMVVLPDGERLLVARDLGARVAFTALMAEAMLLALAGTLVLGVVGGLVMSRRMLTRIDHITHGAAQVMAGNMGHRLVPDGSGDEFDRLMVSLNRMLDQLQRLMDGVRTVSNNVAHDLRSPLTRMRARLEQAVVHGGSAEQMREVCGQVLEETDSLLVTFNALLSIAEAEAGVVVADPVAVDLSRLVEDLADLFGPVAEERGLLLRAEPGGPVTVRGSRELLFQAGANLVDNALKYTPAGGVVVMRAWRDGLASLLEVADSGPGIAPEHRQAALERFTRLDAARSTPGNGLGLSLVSAIVRMHGADLVLADNHPGLLVRLRFAEGR